MSIIPLCFQYNRNKAYWDHPEKTHFPEMQQMAVNSVRGAWHPTGPGCVMSKVTCLAHTTAVCDLQHNAGFHSPIGAEKIRVPIISPAIVSGSYRLQLLA